MKKPLVHQKKAINAVDCISQGWHLAGQNFVLFIGILLIQTFVFSCIPIINIFLYGPVLVGIYYTFLKQLKGEPANLKMMFKGFNNFFPAMVIGIIIGIPNIIGNIIQLSSNLIRNFEIIKPEEVNLFFALHFWAVIIGLIIFFIIFAAFGIFISVSLFFAPPLLAEHEFGTIETIKYSFYAGWDNIGGLLILGLLEMLIAIVGLLACCIGVYFTVPIIIAANTIAYRQVFPESNFSSSSTTEFI